MTQEKLEQLFHKGLGKNQALFLAHEILDGTYRLDEVLDACLNENKSVSMKASYVLSAVSQLDLDAIEAHVPYLIKVLEESPIQGTRREALRMISRCYPWTGEIEEQLVELCLFIIESDETATGEKYHCMRIMNNVGENYPEKMTQFTATLKHKMPELTPAMQRQVNKRFLDED